MAHLLDAATKRKEDVQELISNTKSALDRIKLRAQEAAQDVTNSVAHKHTLVDLIVQFIGAEGLPKMDVIGSADPYFIATIDDKVKMTSSVQVNTLKPIWNEMWYVKNVPSDGKLKITVWDKDDGSPADGRIGNADYRPGSCETDVLEGVKELQIVGRAFNRLKGTFWAQVSVKPASSPHLLPYTFDGPISYSRHFSPTVGLLTNLDENGRRLYSTWKMRLRGVQSYLGGPPQHWNTKYSAAQRIFGTGLDCRALRSSIQAGHRLLYARSTRNGFGVIEKSEDVFALLTGGRAAPHRVKPAVYTYIISVDDDTFRFSETGAAFFVDFASKHALHANCAETVRYSGEFHPRPRGGWENFDDSTSDSDAQWELPNPQQPGEETLCHKASVGKGVPPKKRIPDESTAETETAAAGPAE
ncbi:hypothetical protein M422DRAFT_52548 [Sphaerobolus stellatus SS14]|uniref:C2 domain-containing protein n=1 Tax=Sphaerobolus stellatus (strain SS14) TaxID=990650 RepID=A0A0C9V792_SPHS4|nr:hypothetical protein M422DRAFT_52548 [Sphaerobolus stellatus SS14]